MNKIAYVIVFSLCGLCANAQSLLSDYLKDVGYEGQRNTIISDAVAPALSIIRQQYRLEHKGKFYGKNNQPYYGESYSLGIKGSNGLLLSRNVLLPWEYDPSFQHISSSGKYSPVLYRTMQHSLKDSIWTQVNYEFKKTEYTTPVTPDSLLFRHVDSIRSFGLPESKNIESEDGYIVWVYSRANTQDSTIIHVYLRQESFHMGDETNSNLRTLNPTNSEKIIGGLFVVPKIERAGYIELLLAGVVVKNKEDKWVLSLLAEKSDIKDGTANSNSDDNAKSNNEGESNKTSDNAVEEFEPTLIK